MTADLLLRLATDTTLIELEVLIEIETGEDEATEVPLLLLSVAMGTEEGAGAEAICEIPKVTMTVMTICHQGTVKQPMTLSICYL